MVDAGLIKQLSAVNTADSLLRHWSVGKARDISMRLHAALRQHHEGSSTDVGDSCHDLVSSGVESVSKVSVCSSYATP